MIAKNKSIKCDTTTKIILNDIFWMTSGNLFIGIKILYNITIFVSKKLFEIFDQRINGKPWYLTFMFNFSKKM